MSHLDPSSSREVVIGVKLFLQFQCLVSANIIRFKNQIFQIKIKSENEEQKWQLEFCLVLDEIIYLV